MITRKSGSYFLYKSAKSEISVCVPSTVLSQAAVRLTGLPEPIEAKILPKLKK